MAVMDIIVPIVLIIIAGFACWMLYQFIHNEWKDYKN